MSSFYSITVIMLFLAAGMLSVKLKVLQAGRFIGFFLNISLFMLLFFMGFRIGGNEEVWQALGTIGFISAAFAASTAAGTIIMTVLFYRLSGNRGVLKTDRNRADRKQRPDKNLFTGFKTSLGHAKEPLVLASFVLAGFSSGFFFREMHLYPGFTGESVSSWLLNLLLFLVGAQLAANNVNLKESLLHKDTALLPAAAAAGSLLGGLVAAPFFGLSMGKGLALASGFGWYSLSGVIISDMGDPVLGSAGFLINIFREGIALLLIPFLAETRYPFTGIAVAGATSMDVALPLIEKSCGDEAVPLALSNGALLSVAVPLLVPLFFGLG